MGLLAGSAMLLMLVALAWRSTPAVSPAQPLHPAMGGAAEPPRATVLTAAQPHYAWFGSAVPSADARHLADWVADTGDNAGSAFVIVDKKFATLYVFDADARMRGASPVLLGAAVGDDSVSGIGTRPIADVRPQERTTPAGRFMAERGHNTLGHDVIWVDYDAAVSIHRVRTSNASERRLQRLATPAVDDKRISYGCINVPVAFYEAYVRPTFATRRAPVYVLPEVKPVQQVFGSYDVAAAHGPRAGPATADACAGTACKRARAGVPEATTAPPSPPATRALRS
jgi:hypothetical protein